MSILFYGCSNFIIRYKFVDENEANVGWEEYKIESYSATHYKSLDTNYVFEVLVYSTGKILTSGFVYLPIFPTPEYFRPRSFHEVEITLKSDLNITDLPNFVTIKFDDQKLNYNGRKSTGKNGIYYYEFKFEVDLAYINQIELIFNELDNSNIKIKYPNLLVKRKEIIYYRNSPFAS
ncbi:MAG: hypothetical protein WC121_04535 [Candidatus Kapaibacterium sp.]